MTDNEVYWPGQFLDFFLLGPFVCVTPHTLHSLQHCPFCLLCLFSSLRVLAWRFESSKSLFTNNTPRLIGGNVKASRGHLSLWQAGAKMSHIRKEEGSTSPIPMGIACTKSCTFHFCLFSCSRTWSPFSMHASKRQMSHFPNVPAR